METNTMIKPNELRIGNYYSNNVEVVKLDSKDMIHLLTDDNIHKCSPIPLTEGWLLNFGFKINKNNFYQLNRGSKKTEDFKVFSISKFSTGYNTNSGIKAAYDSIKTVHQLQNLYFDLTGKELILKP